MALPAETRAPSALPLLFLRGRDADGRIAALVAERRGLRPLLGTLAAPLVRRRLHQRLGFRSLGDYARERLGVTAQVVREWSRVAEGLSRLPRLRSAVLSGEVSWTVARRAVAFAEPQTDEAFAETLRGRTVVAAAHLLAAAFGPTSHEAEPEGREDRVRVHVALPVSQQGRWLAAVELARRVSGEALPIWECAEAMAAEALSAISPAHVAAASAVVGRSDGSRAPRPPRLRRAAGARGSREHGVRHQAFPLPRWRRGGAVGAAALDRVAAFAESASPHALDGSLRRALRALQRIDHDLGQILRQVMDRRLHRELGFASFERYVEERVDVSPRTARRQSEAVTFAQAVTLRRLESEQGGTVHGDGGISFFAPAAAANVFRLSLVAVRRHLAARGQTGAGVTAALAWILDHAIATWSEQGARFRDYADFERDGWRCTAPGCTARRNLQSHHIVFRSHGGPDEPWNRTTLCAFHHLRGIHAGTVTCQGRAPGGLVFTLGARARGGPLLRVGAGDVILG